MENLINNDTYQDKLRIYFTNLKIQEKILITFADFIPCVVSGRWNEFLKGCNGFIKKEKFSFSNSEISTELFIHEERGYAAKVKKGNSEEFLFFGTEGAARINAIEWFESTKKEYSKETVHS